MPDFTATRTALKAAALSHPGLRRENNEDRYHLDVGRGLFMVVDGVGGHAAGERAADIAVTMIRTRLERETGAIGERIREAIALANNEIYTASQASPALTGMACVLTVASVRDGRAVVGHVGDSRLYKLRPGTIQKITRDHSPVGDREDRGELSEREAMQHPRRNEIYRDVGSQPHRPDDVEFVDLVDIEFERDCALLLCSDGLSDLVPAARIAEIVTKAAGEPEQVARNLVQAAIEAGGKDNVTVVYVEGDRFAVRSQAWLRGQGVASSGVAGGWAARLLGSRWLALVAGCVLGAALLLGALAWTRAVPLSVRDLMPAGTWPRVWVVSQDGTGDFTTIREALDRARAGDTVRVEPGEYAERVVLTGSVTLESTLPGAAKIVRAADANERAAAVELQAGGARITGFRIVGDASRPLDVGVRFRRANGEADGLDISGTRIAAVEIEGPSEPVLRASYVHENAGYGIRVDTGARPKLLHNVVVDNGRQNEAPKPGIEVSEQARPVLFGNIVINNGVDAIRGLAPAEQAEVARHNVVGRPASPAPPARQPPAPKRGK
jgi:PPM family protein phosphatase